MKLKIALAQINLLVGGIDENRDKIVRTAIEARDRLEADAVVFPELTVTAYPPEDLLLRPDFVNSAKRALQSIAESVFGIVVVVGFPEAAEGKLFNSAAVIRDGKVRAVYRKNKLPNYGVFDEMRYFTPGEEICVFDLNGVEIGLSICEDIWTEGVVERSRQAGAEILFNLNASPFHAGKIYEREKIVRERIRATSIPVVYVNQVGGQDELVFDGASFVMNAKGEAVFRAGEFEESLTGIEFDCSGRPEPVAAECAPPYSEVASEYRALVLGIRDYVAKNGFHGAVLGLSGGIDSALTLALAVDALGKDRVEAVLMPSRYTRDMSIEDAELEARVLGTKYHVIPIEPAVAAFGEMLEGIFAGTGKDTTEENIQARCRGVILMAISNKQGRLLLTTGNKSEMSVGYATLYGDMAGGFAPLKDVPKLLVYRLAEYRNGIAPVIPERVITRPPSAELAPEQKDEDSLPPYAVLDPILERYVEKDQSAEEIIAAGYAEEHVKRAISLVDRNEYKRRQSPPGIRITPRAFGRDRRYPITSGYRGAK
ncbi:MAG: NAD+ synthase [Gammaproteobacteria bacterium]